MTFQLNKDKAIATLLYVINNLTNADMYKTLKIIYFAEKMHIARYGRPILADSYIKVEHGPMPSFLKDVVDGKINQLSSLVDKKGYTLSTSHDSDIDELSESDIECLNESIDINKNLNFSQLKSKSHDSAYDKANWEIDYIDIAKAAGVADRDIPYIQNQIENDELARLWV